MNLLPKHHEEFRQKQYWDRFFTKRGDKAFEWYGNYTDLATSFRSICNPTDRILIIGCGNSALSAEMYNDGFKNIVNIDFSELVIQEMRKKYSHMTWEVMDMTQLTYAAESFDVIVDKGALDALMAQDTDLIRQDATRMFHEIQRVLCLKGRYICITMAQDFILHHLLSQFSTISAWDLAVHQLVIGTTGMSPFIITCKKTKAARSLNLVQCGDERHVAKPQDNSQWLENLIQAKQFYAMTRKELEKIEIGRCFGPIELFDSIDSCQLDPQVKYTVRLVDVTTRGNNGSCGVFLIPQGREHEWMFATKEGIEELANGAGFNRLIVVSLGREFTFDTIQTVQDELSTKIMELVPESVLKQKEKVPYLTIQQGLGHRDIVYTGMSDLSGKFYVEDVKEDDHTTFRRLVFASNTNVIQSEVKLSPALNVDHSYLSFAYHRGIIAGLLGLFPDKCAKIDAVVIGLGGGGLPMHLAETFRQMHITLCELDPSVVEIATKYFGVELNDQMEAKIGDGLELIQEIEESDIIVVDVDSKDITVGMTCPPVAFVQVDFIQRSFQTLKPKGVLVINMSCRDEKLYKEAMERISQVFSDGTVLELEASEEDVNRVVFAIKDWKIQTLKETFALDLVEQLNRVV